MRRQYSRGCKVLVGLVGVKGVVWSEQRLSLVGLNVALGGEYRGGRWRVQGRYPAGSGAEER